MADSKKQILFLRAFLNELLGRYVGLHQFIDRSRREAGGQSTTLLEEYSRNLNTNVIRLLNSVETLYDLPVADDRIDKLHLLGFFSTLITESEEFQKTHRTLRWFSEPWPDAELFQFLSQVFKERGLRTRFEELNPSIVFHDVYNFLTYDIGYMQHSVNRAELDAWALPKAESSNPLLWTVLVHEVAHDLYKDPQIYNYLRERLELFPKDESKGLSLLNRLHLWSRELNADLLSFYVLGPAYLYSLIYFSVFFVRNDLRTPFLTERANIEIFEKGSKDTASLHPPPRERIQLLLYEMESLNLTDSDEYEIYKSLFEARCEFDNADNFYEDKDSEKIALTPALLKQLWNVLKSMQSDLHPHGVALGQRDLTNVRSLFKRLDARELACSLPSPDSTLALAYVEETLPNIQPSTPKQSRPKISRQEALKQLNEEPARMIDIINAGWMLKARDPYWREPILRVRGIQDLESKWPKLLDKLIEPSRQIQESIQVALILSSLALDEISDE